MRSIIILNHVKIVKVLHRFTEAKRTKQNMVENVKYLLTFTGELGLRLTVGGVYSCIPRAGCHDDTRWGTNIGHGDIRHHSKWL